MSSARPRRTLTLAEEREWERVPSSGLHFLLSDLGRRRFPTGLPTLDKLTGGGIPPETIVALIGPPGAGKSVLGRQVGRSIWKSFPEGKLLAISADQGPRATLVCLGQQLGLDRDKLEGGDAETLAALKPLLSGLMQPVPSLPLDLILDAPWDVCGATLIDSLHTCNVEVDERADQSIRQRIELGMRLVRYHVDGALEDRVAIVTSEANRSFYASKDPERRSAGISAGAESRAIEYQSDIVLTLVEEQPFVTKVTVEKNRVRGDKGTFRIRLDRDRATYYEIDEAAAAAERDEAAERRANEASLRVQSDIEHEIQKRKPPADRPGWSLTDLAGFTNVGRNSIALRSAIRGLVAQGFIEEVGGPRGHAYWRLARKAT